MTITTRFAKDRDIDVIVSLLSSVGLPSEDIDLNKQTFMLAFSEDQFVGCVAYEKYGQWALLRSLAVYTDFEGKGIAKLLLTCINKTAKDDGVEVLFLLTTTARSFFAYNRWISISRSSVPEIVRSSSQFSSICPSSADCMYLRLVDDEIKSAIDAYQSGFNCAQSVLSAFSEQFGIDKATACRMNSGMVAGIGFKGQLCSAVGGAYQLIGLKYGRSKPEDDLSKELTYSAMRKFDTEFINRNGTLQCSELLGHQVNSEEGLDAIIQNELFEKLCPRFIKDSAEIVKSIIE